MRNLIFCYRINLTLFLLSTLLLNGCDRQQLEAKHVHVVFRFDDYSAQSSPDRVLRIIDAFRKHEATVTFGVIPFRFVNNDHGPTQKDIIPIPSKQEDILRTAFKDGIVDVALHGYFHRSIKGNEKNEFDGLDYDTQVERLKRGKQYLEEIIDAPITTFVPPWNRYDLNTIRALEEVGFTTLSAAKHGTAKKNTKLLFLPATCHLNKIRDAVVAARNSFSNQPVIVILFHDYDFKERGKKGSLTFQELDDILNWLKSQDNVNILSISNASKTINDLSVNRFMLTKEYYSIARLLPTSLRKEFIYHEAPDKIKTCLKVGSFYFAIVSIAAIFAFMIGTMLYHKAEFLIKFGILGITVISIFIIIYAFHDLKIHFKGMITSSVAIGAFIGLWMCLLYQKKKRL